LENPYGEVQLLHWRAREIIDPRAEPKPTGYIAPRNRGRHA